MSVEIAVASLPEPGEAATTEAGLRREIPLLRSAGIELRPLTRRSRLMRGGDGRGTAARGMLDATGLALGLAGSRGSGVEELGARGVALGRGGASGARALARGLAVGRRASGVGALDARGVRAAVACDRALRWLRNEETRLVVSLGEDDLLKPGGVDAACGVALAHASLTIVASAGLEPFARAAGARAVAVVHPAVELELGKYTARLGPPTIVTVGELSARKRAGDVIRAVAVLGERHRELRCEIVGDGPERDALARLARELGIAERVELTGELRHEEAIERTRRATIYAMPSTDEAFGSYYLDAMVAGVPAIGCRGEPGPEEIAAAGAGLVLVPPGDIERLSQRIDELLSDRARLRSEALHARETVAASFTWERRARALAAAYALAIH